MPTLTTEIANAVMTHEGGYMPRSTMMSSKPFVVSSISTKRYAPAKKVPVQRPPRIPSPTSTKERLSVHRGAPTKQASRPGSLPTAVPKAESRRPSSKLAPMPAPNKTTKVQKAPPLPLVSSADRSLSKKTFIPKALKVVQRLKEGKLVGGCPAPVPVTRWSTQVTTMDELPPRPSCVPRSRIYRSSVRVTEASKVKQDMMVKVSITGPPMTKTAGRVRATDISVKKPVVTGDYRTGAPARDRRLTQPKPTVYPQGVSVTSYVEWSPPPSPDLSSFPSQSWTIVADVDVRRIKTPTPTIHSDESLSSMGDVPKSVSSSSTVIQTLESPEESTVGSDGMAEMSSPTKGPSVKISHMVCDATIISPSRNGTASMATLAKVIDSNQVSSATEFSDTGNRALMTVRGAIEIARSLFSSSSRASESSVEITVPKAMGTNVSRIRKLFTPSLDKDAKVSNNPVTQMEIEMLRAQKKVAGSGVVDPRLDCLGSLSAMAIVTKLGTSDSEIPDRI